MKIRPLVALGAILALPVGAQERPVIEVSASDFQPLPIAVAPFAPDGDGVAREVCETVRGDLTLSGLFKVLDPKGFLADPSEGLGAASIKFQRWGDVGADGLVKAAIGKGADGQATAEYHLYDVRAARELTTGGETGGARTLGHRSADAVLRHYTREPGVFATRSAAIR